MKKVVAAGAAALVDGLTELYRVPAAEITGWPVAGCEPVQF